MDFYYHAVPQPHFRNSNSLSGTLFEYVYLSEVLNVKNQIVYMNAIVSPSSYSNAMASLKMPSDKASFHLLKWGALY